jgi:HD superfamily phosphohydrolase
MKKQSVILKDTIYGSYEITSPIILELLASPSTLRLKDISQMGPPDPYYHIKNYSRYVHSVGVMLILKHLGASELEQVAGLLHDVSHTTFSHLVDWVVGSEQTESFQDDQHESFIQNSKLPGILKKYGYSVKQITNYKQFTLLEQDIPALCADRIDYSLREFRLADAKTCFSHLVNYQNKIVFNDVDAAYLFAHGFLERQSNHWGGYEAVTRYNLFAKALKRALKLNMIDMGVFQGKEKPIIRLLENSNDIIIQDILSTLKQSSVAHLKKDVSPTRKKFRYVDPDVLISRHVRRLSSLSSQFKNEIEKARINNEKGVFSGTL